MTTIAYRDGVLAADTLITSGSARVGAVMKIASYENVMGGVSGSAGGCQLFIDWIVSGAKGLCPELPEGADGIFVRDGKTFYVGPDSVLVPFDAPFAAVGSGEKIALGAMAMGAGAVAAVGIAAMLDIYTDGPIAVMKIDSDGRISTEIVPHAPASPPSRTETE